MNRDLVWFFLVAVLIMVFSFYHVVVVEEFNKISGVLVECEPYLINLRMAENFSKFFNVSFNASNWSNYALNTSFGGLS